MSVVKVLIEGYAKEVKGGWIASSTTTLIEDSGKRIIVDPGTNRELLLNKLEKEGLKTSDINIVFLTHYHVDHALLAGIFVKAKVLDGAAIYDQDKEFEYSGKIPGTNIKVIETPGHTDEQSVLLISTDKGVVVVASDLFWWMDSEKQETDSVGELLNRKDPYVKDIKALGESRKKVLEIADWIIPGHGKMFRNPKRK